MAATVPTATLPQGHQEEGALWRGPAGEVSLWHHGLSVRMTLTVKALMRQLELASGEVALGLVGARLLPTQVLAF